MKLYHILFSFLFITSCDPSDHRLKIYNKTDYSIFCFFSFNENLTLNDSNIVEPYNGKAIKSTEIYTLRGYLLNWENEIKHSKDKKIRIYIYQEDTVLQYSWKKLIEEKKYDKLYVLSFNDLKQMGWIIPYSR